METKLQRLERAIQYLKGKGLVRRQKDIAAQMCTTESSVSNALADRSGSLNDNFLLRFNRAFGDVFSNAWLLDGTGEMLAGGGQIRAGLTTYWARHSWATIAASLDIPEDTIALALGHSSAHTTTAIYIERRLSKVDAANRKVLDLFL